MAETASTEPDGVLAFDPQEVEGSIPARFETIVRLHPERLAIKDNDRSLTYTSLNGFANRIARTVLRRGRRERPVAVLLENGIEAVASILGVLKAGRFYVFLDPSFALERLTYMLEDSEAGSILTHSGNIQLAHQLTRDSASIMNIDEIDDSASAGDLGLAVSPDDLTTLTYTSGSSGKPKGVIETHRYRLHDTMIHTRAIGGVSIDDRLSLLHSLSFASAQIQLTRSLLNGASLFPFALRSEGVRDLARWIANERITILHTPVALFRQLADVLPPPREIPGLRVIHLSGAPVTHADFERYRSRCSSQTTLVIHMGATETGGICSLAANQDFSFPREGAPVGYACADKQICLLDRNGREVGPNGTGEIAVKSRYLTSGYWRNPELTQLKFLSDPNGGNERLYLTGDLGRMAPGGVLVHVGRKDFMVKIRGHRVEPSEIERTLLSHPEINEAAVAAWDREDGEKYLAAYIVARHEPPPTVSRLHDFLRRKLPSYMIPSAFVFVESLPLINGKLDRRALPIPGNSRPRLEHAFAAPRNAIEQLLADIWADVLNLRQIGVHDNFYELGGDSVRAAQILARAAQAGLQLTARDVFERQNIAELAAVARLESAVGRPRAHASTACEPGRAGSGSRAAADFPLPKPDEQRLLKIIARLARSKPAADQTLLQDIEDIYPLTPAQRTILFYSLSRPADRAVYHHQFCYTLHGELDVASFERSWRHVLQRHSIFRTAFVPDDFQILKRRAQVRFVYRDRRGLAPDEQEKEFEAFVESDRTEPFDLSEPPLMRLALFRLSETTYRFVRTFHHVILDGWSSSILWNEVLGCYEAFYCGRVPEQSPAPVFRSYVAWIEQQQARNPEAEAFWRGLLNGFSRPTSLERAGFSAGSGRRKTSYGRIRAQLSRDETAALKAFAQEHRLTMSALAQAAWGLALARTGGQSDVTFGTVLCVRPAAVPGVESIIGPLINALPFRVRLAPAESVRALLQRLHREQVEISHYAYSSPAKVHEWSGIPPGVNLFSGIFLFQNYPESPTEEHTGRFALRLDRVFGRTISPLATVVRPGPELSLAIGFDEGRFDQRTIAALLSDFQTFLRAVVARPECSVAELLAAGARSHCV
ncbi:MAG TPA: condensation domain-containing protein [Candidatus Eisenbacteria bacterium]|nr:condensation domain-containing protein [Candidatus Eisenbacteria bacterium]